MLISCKLSMQTHGEAAHLPPHFAYGKSGTCHFSKVNCTSIVGQYGVLKTNGVLCYAKGDTLDEALEDAIHSAYDWISLELTEEEVTVTE